MYKAFQNKKHYLAFNTFPKTAKNVSKVYHTGIRIWKSDDMDYYTLVLGTFRIMLGFKKTQLTCCGDKQLTT